MAPSFKTLKQILLPRRATDANSDAGLSVQPSHSSIPDGGSIPQETTLQFTTPVPVDESQAYDDPGFGIKVLIPGTNPTIE
jgi:hypothetical protein